MNRVGNVSIRPQKLLLSKQASFAKPEHVFAALIPPGPLRGGKNNAPLLSASSDKTGVDPIIPTNASYLEGNALRQSGLVALGFCDEAWLKKKVTCPRRIQQHRNSTEHSYKRTNNSGSPRIVVYLFLIRYHQNDTAREQSAPHFSLVQQIDGLTRIRNENRVLQISLVFSVCDTFGLPTSNSTASHYFNSKFSRRHSI